MKNKLKPCPFCGGAATLLIVHKTSVLPFMARAECGRCNIEQSYSFATRNEAIAAWNRRAEDEKQIRA